MKLSRNEKHVTIVSFLLPFPVALLLDAQFSNKRPFIRMPIRHQYAARCVPYVITCPIILSGRSQVSIVLKLLSACYTYLLPNDEWP